MSTYVIIDIHGEKISKDSFDLEALKCKIHGGMPGYSILEIKDNGIILTKYGPLSSDELYEINNTLLRKSNTNPKS